MNSKKQILIIIAVLVIGMVAGGSAIYVMTSGKSSGNGEATLAESGNGEQLYTCGMHPDVISDEPGNCPICGMKLTPIQGSGTGSDNDVKKDRGEILYWQAPMDPTYISDEPGKSPMGMDLVPVYEGDVGGSNIRIDPQTVQNMGITTMPVKRRDLNRKIRAVGTITYDEEKLYTVNAKISGWIEKLHVNYTGQEVRKGEPLLEIYSPDLVSAQEEYLLALKNKEIMNASKFDEIKSGAQSLLASTRKRLENWDIPQSAISKIEERGAVSKTMTLTSPANGIVIHKNAVDGVHVKEGTNIYQIADLSTVWAEASVYEYELPWIDVGAPATMELPYIPGKKIDGKISYIYPYLNDKTRSAKVRLEFRNPNNNLKPDMYANIVIDTKAEQDALVIPGESVIRSGVRNIVFVTRDEGTFEPREVKLGVEGEGGYVQVLAGLLEGEQVVTSGQFLLDSESNAQEAIKKMLAAREQTGQSQSEKSHEETEHSHEEADYGESDADHQHEEDSMKAHESHEHQDKKQNKKHESYEHQEKAGEQVTTALYTCPMHPEFVTDDPDQRCPDCGMKLEKKKDLEEGAELYTCPMHPEFVSDDPDDRCSICEMKLVKKTATDDSRKRAAESSSALYTCPMHPEFVTDDPEQRCPDCGMKLEKKKELEEDAELFTCPMHPEFVSDDPDDRCSICEMKLVKKTDDSAESSSALYTCPMHPEFVTDDPEQRCPDCGMKLEKKKDLEKDAELYTCPMHPEFVSDDPDDRCSICEMKLEKK